MLDRDGTYRVLAKHLISELTRIEARLASAERLHGVIHEVAQVDDGEPCPMDAAMALAARAVERARKMAEEVVELQVAGLRPIGEVAQSWRQLDVLDLSVRREAS